MAEADEAPHGRDSSGKPLAPYGYKTDGKPRKSNRGAAPGQFGGGSGRSASNKGGPLTEIERKQMLCELSAMLIEGPLASASEVPLVRSYIGPKQADALAGTSFLISQYVPPIADALVLVGRTNPRWLSWMDKAEENGPMLVLASAVFTAGAHVVKNHLDPDPALAEAGRNLAKMRMQQMAAEVNAQAAAFKAAQERAAAEDAADAAAHDMLVGV
jgi:hypothetical protein